MDPPKPFTPPGTDADDNKSWEHMGSCNNKRNHKKKSKKLREEEEKAKNRNECIVEVAPLKMLGKEKKKNKKEKVEEEEKEVEHKKEEEKEGEKKKKEKKNKEEEKEEEKVEEEEEVEKKEEKEEGKKHKKEKKKKKDKEEEKEKVEEEEKEVGKKEEKEKQKKENKEKKKEKKKDKKKREEKEAEKEEEKEIEKEEEKDEERKNQNDLPATGKAEKTISNKKRKIAYIYGNYKFYYGYRIDRNSKEDPRLLAFKREWFQGKDCLDIGCNQGLVTINIAKRFSCRSIIGIDIDGDLIEAANSTLRKIANTEAFRSRLPKRYQFNDKNSGRNNTHKNFQLAVQEEAEFSEHDSTKNEYDLLQTVSFRKENFVEHLNGFMERYDTVLCLSVSKWVHLNWGDEGLITLFVKIWRILRPGGMLLFEPQPWKSYEKNRRVSEDAKLNFRNIIFTPEVFEEILLDKIGFKSVENLSERLDKTVAGFERPIFAFKK